MSEATPYEYRGPAHLEARIAQALRDVVDPEMALNIVSLGLVYAVEADGGCAKVRLTMTSAACPVADVIVDEVIARLTQALGPGSRAEVELVWDPPWEPERMSASARAAMGWD